MSFISESTHEVNNKLMMAALSKITLLKQASRKRLLVSAKIKGGK